MLHFVVQRNPGLFKPECVDAYLSPILRWANAVPLTPLLPNLFEGVACDIPAASACPLREDDGVEVVLTVLRFLQLVARLIDATARQSLPRDELQEFATRCLGVWNSDVQAALPCLALLLGEAWASSKEKFIASLHGVVKGEPALFFDMQVLRGVEVLLPTAKPIDRERVFKLVADYLVDISHRKGMLPVRSASSSHVQVNIGEVVLAMARVLALRAPSDYWRDLISTVDQALRSLQETVCIPIHRSQVWTLVVQETTRFESLLTAAVPPVDTLMREMRFDPQMAAVFERMSDAQAASLVENWTRVVSQVPENDVRALKVCEI